MPKPYDATAKFLVTEYPLDWLSLTAMSDKSVVPPPKSQMTS